MSMADEDDPNRRALLELLARFDGRDLVTFAVAVLGFAATLIAGVWGASIGAKASREAMGRADYRRSFSEAMIAAQRLGRAAYIAGVNHEKPEPGFGSARRVVEAQEELRRSCYVFQTMLSGSVQAVGSDQHWLYNTCEGFMSLSEDMSLHDERSGIEEFRGTFDQSVEDFRTGLLGRLPERDDFLGPPKPTRTPLPTPGPRLIGLTWTNGRRTPITPNLEQQQTVTAVVAWITSVAPRSTPTPLPTPN